MWRLFEYVRDHIDDPLASLPMDDSRLAQAVTGIVADAAEMSVPPTDVVLGAQLATVDITAIDRQMERARQEGTGGIATLRKRRDELVAQRDELIATALERR